MPRARQRPRPRPVRRTLAAVSFVSLASAAGPWLSGAHAQRPAPRVPLTPGLTVVETLTMSDAERESVTTLAEATDAGVRYVWRFVEVREERDTIRDEYARFVSAADLAGAGRLHTFWEKDASEKPGYTSRSLSSAVYRQVREEGSAPFALMLSEPPRGATGPLAQLGITPDGRHVPVLWRGTLTRVSDAPAPFPLLVNGRRVTVSALHLRGRFTSRGRTWEPEFWVLADDAHPLLLRVTRSYPGTDNVLQTVRVDLPDEPGQAAGGSDGPGASARALETALASECRVELPGIYFAFNSALLDPASDRALAQVAAMLERHPDWRVTIEGHTDSIGSAGSNRTLSERRAQAVREALAGAHGVDPGRLRTVGHGASSPRESNATIEGRARNRRVELARECGA